MLIGYIRMLVCRTPFLRNGKEWSDGSILWEFCPFPRHGIICSMWAHYAEEHTGFVLMLDGSHDFFKGNNPLLGFAKPERVEYKSERPSTTIEEVTMSDIFFTKGSDWQYEKEWRYLKFLNDADKRHETPNTPSVELFRLPPKCYKGRNPWVS